MCAYPAEYPVDPIAQLRKEMGKGGWRHRLVRVFRTRTRQFLKTCELFFTRKKKNSNVADPVAAFDHEYVRTEVLCWVCAWYYLTVIFHAILFL